MTYLVLPKADGRDRRKGVKTGTSSDFPTAVDRGREAFLNGSRWRW